MARIKSLVETSDLNLTRFVEQLDRGQVTTVRFDEYVDMLVVYVVPPGKADTVVHYVDEYVGLIYTPENMEVVGFQVEAFKRAFLPHHASVNESWKLSEPGVKLVENAELADLIMFVERRKVEVVQEVAKTVNDDLFERVRRKKRELAYA